VGGYSIIPPRSVANDLSDITDLVENIDNINLDDSMGLTSGEYIPECHGVYVDSFGKFKIAHANNTDQVIGCIGITFSNCAANALPDIRMDNIISNPNLHFTNIGYPIFLQDDGSIGSNSGAHIKELGIALNTNTMIVVIKPPILT